MRPSLIFLFLDFPFFNAISPAIVDKSEGDFTGFSVRFPGFSWPGMVRACPGTHFRAQKSIFDQKMVFLVFSACVRGRGGSRRVHGITATAYDKKCVSSSYGLTYF